MIIEEYEVCNLDCASCGAKIESKIADLDGVDSVNLDFMNRKMTIQYSEKIDDVLVRLNQIAQGIEPDVKVMAIGAESPEKSNKPWHLVLAMLFMAIALRLSPLGYLVMGLLAYLAAGHKVIYKAGKELFSRQVFGEHLLMTIATFGAIYLGEITEAMAVMGLYEIGQYLESLSLAKSRATIRSILALKPERAHRKSYTGIEEIDLKMAELGDLLLVYPGERIPLDSVVIKGETTMDTSSVTGESEPVAATIGSELYAGFVNGESLIEIKVMRKDAESMISRIMALIEQAGSRKSNTERFITRFARYYTPAVVLSALLVYLIPLLLGYPGEVWFKRALIFLIVSCPCALVISIPLSFYIGIGKAAKQGIIFKGSIYLDILHKVKTLVFDKTGTLTTGSLKVLDVLPAAGIEPQELEESLYISEYTSSHPFAKAVKAKFIGSFDPAKAEAISEYPGKGILMVYEGNKLIAGNEAFIRSFGFMNFVDSGVHSAVHIVKNDQYLGCVTFGDELKARIEVNLDRIRQTGVKHLSMLSGDKKAKAELVARQLGLNSFHAELLPEQKLGQIEALMSSQHGLVAYCGDGLNDSPVLARADIGIAMGKIGAQASIETADIVLLNDRPEQLAQAFALSQSTKHLVWQNIILALGIKVLVMALGLAGISGLWEAIIADVGVTLLVILNSLRMMNKPVRCPA